MKGVDATTLPDDSGTADTQARQQRVVAGNKASKKELSPMALGVLNNLSAIYAENT